MTKSDKLPTIGNASMSAGVSKEAFQKRIIRALKDDKLSDIRQKLGIKSDTPTGLRDPFTPELSALLSASGFDVPTVFPTEEPDTRLPKNPNPIKPPTKKTDTPEELTPKELLYLFEQRAKHNAARQRALWEIKADTPEEKTDTIQPTKPDAPEIRQPEPDKKPDTTISDRFFQSEIIVLSALLILIFSDGFSMSLLAGRTFGGSGLAYVLFSVVGLIIGYSAISTTRAAYHAPRRVWEKSWAPFWIVLFAIFQTALHGSAFDLFGDWSDLVGRVLIVLSIPLATASLTTTILKR